MEAIHLSTLLHLLVAEQNILLEAQAVVVVTTLLTILAEREHLDKAIMAVMLQATQAGATQAVAAVVELAQPELHKVVEINLVEQVALVLLPIHLGVLHLQLVKILAVLITMLAVAAVGHSTVRQVQVVMAVAEPVEVVVDLVGQLD
jgi:hypothetical protein